MSLLDTFNSITLETIQDYLERGQEEHLHLDFKTVKSSSLNSSDDKRNLAKAVSGFSNSAGGILVWGIVAKKDDDGVDRATSEERIEGISRLMSRLNELSGEASSPLNDGIVHKAISGSGESGFVASYIPESDVGPHMAKLGLNRYYKRSGDSFYPMEHYDVADMFGRRMKPNIELVIRVENPEQNPRIFLGMRNNGRGSAKAPYIGFIPPSPLKLSPYGTDGNRGEALRKLSFGPDSTLQQFGADSAVVIHPGTTFEFATLFLGHGFPKEKIPRGPLSIDYEVAAEGMPLAAKTVQIEILPRKEE